MYFHGGRWWPGEHRPMTFMLGAVCADGVVLIGDRKVTWGEGERAEYDDKVLTGPAPMAAGCAGNMLLGRMFRDATVAYFQGEQKKLPLGVGVGVGGFLNEMEDVVKRLGRRYIVEGRTVGGISALVALDMVPWGGVALYQIHEGGIREQVDKYRAIGSGEPHARLFLERLWKPELKMLDCAALGYFLIIMIERRHLDPMVGIGDGPPQVWLLPRTPLNADRRFASPLELDQLRVRAESLLARMDDGFSTLGSEIVKVNP